MFLASEPSLVPNVRKFPERFFKSRSETIEEDTYNGNTAKHGAVCTQMLGTLLGT